VNEVTAYKEEKKRLSEEVIFHTHPISVRTLAAYCVEGIFFSGVVFCSIFFDAGASVTATGAPVRPTNLYQPRRSSAINRIPLFRTPSLLPEKTGWSEASIRDDRRSGDETDLIDGGSSMRRRIAEAAYLEYIQLVADRLLAADGRRNTGFADAIRLLERISPNKTSLFDIEKRICSRCEGLC
jgi:hypothetical protein